MSTAPCSSVSWTFTFVASNVPLDGTGMEYWQPIAGDAPIRYILNTPTNHIMHHEKMRGNYGLYFNIWDRLMGTNHRDYETRFREVTSRGTDAA